MRLIFALFVTVLVGCVGVTPTRSDQIAVSAHHVSTTCRPDDLTDAVAIHIENGGAKLIGFPVEASISNTPLGLYPSTFAILGKPNGASAFDYWHLTTEEFDPPTRLAFIGPGDSADFSIPIGPWSPDEKSIAFAVRVWDTEYHPYDSGPFWLCQAQNTPNN